jgi:hypothetical protein
MTLHRFAAKPWPSFPPGGVLGEGKALDIAKGQGANVLFQETEGPDVQILVQD